MTDLLAWREKYGLSQLGAAEVFGISPRQWRYYEAGEKPLPKWMTYALLGYGRGCRSIERNIPFPG